MPARPLAQLQPIRRKLEETLAEGFPLWLEGRGKRAGTKAGGPRKWGERVTWWPESRPTNDRAARHGESQRERRRGSRPIEAQREEMRTNEASASHHWGEMV